MRILTKIVLTGRIQTGSYTNRDGQKVYTTDIVVEEQEFAESKAAAAGNSGQGNYSRSSSAPSDTNEFMTIPDNIDDEDIADYLSDQTGFCHFGFDVVETDQEATARTRSYTDEELENLWLQFGNIPMDPESETMEDSFLDFLAGTHREDIWHWFDERYSKGVYALLYGK